MKKLMILVLLLCSLCSTTYAMQTDKAAHFAVSYTLSDQLAKHTKMTRLERMATVLFIGYAKEQWVDSKFDRNDFAADMAGVLFYEWTF